MAKELQMSIKMQPELRDRFMAVAGDRHRPAAQIIRDLMRLYIADSETPNALTAEILGKSREGEDAFNDSSASDLFKQLGIWGVRPRFTGQLKRAVKLAENELSNASTNSR